MAETQSEIIFSDIEGHRAQPFIDEALKMIIIREYYFNGNLNVPLTRGDAANIARNTF